MKSTLGLSGTRAQDNGEQPHDRAPTYPSSGTGLMGLSKRAQICGGTFQAGPDDQGRFTVSCHLPWRSKSVPPTPAPHNRP